MSDGKSLPRGLRHVLVYAFPGASFPPPRDSASDIALIRAANTAMQRKAKGTIDGFVFVIVGTDDTTAVEAAIRDYGFPACTLASSALLTDDDAAAPDIEELTADTGPLVAKVLVRHHPGAIAYLGSEYDATQCWWSGVEGDDTRFDWVFSEKDYASQLPATHSARAKTWLAILGHAMELDKIHATNLEGIARQRGAMIAATLAEWLHGFEAASGNDWNPLEPKSAIQALRISEFFLGFRSARIAGVELDAFADKRGVDLDGLSGEALKLITRTLRADLRNALSRFFGGDSALFWALHSAIWPRFDLPILESCNALLQRASPDDLGELEPPWSFVQDGWCDGADS